MKKLKIFLGIPRVLAAAALVLSLSMPVLAVDLPAANPMKEQKTVNPLTQKIRRELILLSNYTVFDNLEFRLENKNTVVLSGQVVWATLKDAAENAVKHIEGITPCQLAKQILDFKIHLEMTTEEL